MDLIDTHVHVWDPHRGYPWLTGPLRRRYGIDNLRSEIPAGTNASVVLIEAGRGDHAESADLLALAAAEPDVVGVVGAAGLATHGAVRRLERILSDRNGQYLIGIREQLDARLLAQLGRARPVLAERRLTLELNCALHQLSLVADVVRTVGPSIAIVIDHLGGPPSEPSRRADTDLWRNGLIKMAALPNVYVKLSGLLTQITGPATWRAGLIRQAVEVLGPNRTMVGSDWPICLVGGSWSSAIDTVLTALSDLGSDEVASVRTNTARAAFHLAARRPAREAFGLPQ